MKNKIPKILCDIGKLAYLLAILTGKNYQVKKITKEIVSKNKETKQIEIPGDFIITVGKKSIILTKHQNGRREPIIVKPWKRGKIFYEGNRKTIPYIDIESYSWLHIFDEVGELITFFKDGESKDDDLIFYHLELK